MAALLAIAAELAVAAPRCHKVSGVQLTALVELYTSEGCSSCPPADAWLRQLPATGVAAERAVPIALHVDYWDSLGWKDAFADPRFTGRQRAIAARGGAAFVYTPPVVLNGRDFRAWPSPAFAAEIAAVHRRPAKATIELEIVAREGAPATLRPEAALVDVRDSSSAALFLVPYRNGLVTRVTAGENGRRHAAARLRRAGLDRTAALRRHRSGAARGRRAAEPSHRWRRCLCADGRRRSPAGDATRLRRRLS